ncbi:MAG: SdrD B-like domain-containing protein, partial [Rhodanobacter sp.]
MAGFVYVDLNGNGARDAGETGIAGVTLTITNLTTSATNITLTDPSGAYQVNNLPAGNYSISETQPADYADGAESVGSLGGVLGPNDVITSIPLGVTELGSDYNFGELAASLSGNVYIDVDGNGTRGAGEPGIAGVAVTLSGIDTNGGLVNTVLSSDSTGHYAFVGLLPSNPSGYTITQTQPGAYADGAESVGSLGGASGAVGTSVISGIPVVAGANGNNYDFGELTGGIVGAVYVDTNNDGVRDAGETGIAGVSVRLTGTDVDGKAVDVTVLSASDGGYAFASLTKADAAGYTITETQPVGYI